MNKTEKLNELFASAEFLEANKDLNNLEDVYEATRALIPDLSKEELSAYLENVSMNMQNGEVSEEDLENVAGGGILAVAGGIAAVCGAIRGCYAVGTGIGKFIYNISHR